MDEGLSRLQERQLTEHSDFFGMEYPSLYLCKPKRGMKRDDSKEAYKLPHRLIEKKRRDRINECIAQLKDLLPEHLKLTTLGHLEKAVVLELTLKHLKALTALTEQQHQKIIALQNGTRSVNLPMEANLEVFHSGFHACAKEVLQYLSRFESWTPREQRCAQLINHLHNASTQVLQDTQILAHIPVGKRTASARDLCDQKVNQSNCVPVIQRTHNVEQNENDTDTDSGYGGEADKTDGKVETDCKLIRDHDAPSVRVKLEPDDHPIPKRMKVDPCESAIANHDQVSVPEGAVIGSLMGFGSVPFGQQTPFCLPFYFISPSAAAAYMPFLDKNNLEKYLCPAPTPFPLIYPGIPTNAAFPGLSLFSSEKACAAASLLSQSLPSCFATETVTCMDAGLSGLDDANSTQESLESGGDST
ncbi:class E basic helix-loop-helix protein 41 [Protopterus annectens]|uniref:class E basic helix-loop-helix protein 41 n=1 Tax=Protopterus annectens TaxID=7888 RepID=UPI001CFACDFE|nr:class E basic helix-loop-helix protein 41 [Protopterus annectens]